MISTSLGQAVAAFSKALNSLRQKYIEDFAASLREPFNRRKLSAEWINEKIASLRRDFAAEFVNTASVPVIRALSPGSEQSTVERLSSVQIEFRSLASAAPAAADRGDGGRAMLRAVVGAGLGAAAALILVTMQIHQPLAGPARPPARDITHPRGNGTSSDGGPATGEAATPTPEVKPPALTATPPDASASSGAQPVQPSPPPPSASGGATPQPNHFLQSAFSWIIAGTLGAVFGAFLVCFTTLPMLDRFAGRSRTISLGSRRKGADLGTGGVVLSAVGAVIATGVIAASGRMISGPKPVWTGFGAVCAVLLILVARFLTVPRRASPGPTGAIEALEHELIAESNFWSVLSGSLVSQKTDFRTVAIIKGIIVEHRSRSERGEDILQLVEQELGLPVGGHPPRASNSAPGDFIWTAEHEKLYDTFGIVEVGDRVKVKVPSRTVTSSSGATTVVQRGLVSRSREP